MEVISIILLFVTGLPLVVYPAVFIAGVMSFAAEPSKGISWALKVISKLFIVTSLLYPGVYLFAGKLAKKAAAVSDKNETLYAAIPLGYLGVLCILYWVWSKFE